MKFYILVHRVIIFICLFNFKTFMIEDIVDFYLAKKRKGINKGEVREFFFFLNQIKVTFWRKKMDGNERFMETVILIL